VIWVAIGDVDVHSMQRVQRLIIESATPATWCAPMKMAHCLFSLRCTEFGRYGGIADIE
jgi:hypothetical protein